MGILYEIPVHVTATYDHILTIEADSEEEAMEKADNEMWNIEIDAGQLLDSAQYDLSGDCGLAGDE